ncbi:hypothetical protein PMIN01_00627 [Paraphaeosphaeria minitans]|uniref:Uncharacterized protein n=1 Tax=Paraphaeosphaeria minitans TaxID=565426 RepID=A0A9P6GTQ7_9PLEO|nr:hypothetical protein PMIN01_00627 [Paraphaeosphaeria minitans]
MWNTAAHVLRRRSETDWIGKGSSLDGLEPYRVHSKKKRAPRVGSTGHMCMLTTADHCWQAVEHKVAYGMGSIAPVVSFMCTAFEGRNSQSMWAKVIGKLPLNTDVLADILATPDVRWTCQLSLICGIVLGRWSIFTAHR